MQTIFSHIVQKRLSQESENIATEALAFILNSSEHARNGLLKVLRGACPGLPSLRFRTQHSVGDVRPDMWGFAGESPRVYIENKFWAGLTEKQPVDYLKHLAKYQQPSLLLFVVPEARQETVWRELLKRLSEASISISENPSLSGIVRAVSTEDNPILAITSWENLLHMIEAEVPDDSDALNDLLQLRSLCGAVALNSFTPITAEELSDQRTPSFILQLEEVVKASVDLSVTEGSLTIDGLKQQINKERIGQYIFFPTIENNGFGAWFGIHLTLWKKYGGSPLWLVFSTTKWGRALAAQPVLEPWANQNGLMSALDNDFVISIDLPVGEEKDAVTNFVASRLKDINRMLWATDHNNEK